MISQSSFFEPVRYQPDAEEDIMQFLFQIILDTFEQFEEITNRQQYQRDKERQKERAMGLVPSDAHEYPTKTALVFFLDNAQQMNQSDWRFYMMLATNNQHPLLKNLVIILNIEKIKMYIQPQQRKNDNPLPKSTSNYELMIDQSAQSYYFNEIKDIEDELYDQIIDLTPINKDTIYKVLFNQSEIYQKQMSAEIDKRVLGQDADLIANAKKAEHDNEEEDDMIAGELEDSNPDNELENLKSQLYRKYQVFAQYKSIDPEVIDYIQMVSEGNPMVVLSYFHNLLIKGYLEIVEIENKFKEKEFQVVFTKKLQSALSHYDNNHISPQVQLPYEIFCYQSLFIDYSTSKLSLKAEAPYVVVACDYTLLVCSLIGSKFSTQILVESGACPEYFYASQFQKISIFKVLDLLEDCDFIEMFHEELIDSYGKKSQLNRFYRFNFRFIASVISQMKPFFGLKNNLHFALAEYFKSHQHLDASTDYKQSNDLKMLTRQLLENRRIIYQEKLNVESQQSILRKYITLLLFKMKQKKEEQQQQTSKNNHVVLLQSQIKIESDEVVKYMTSIRKNKLFEISIAVEKIHELKIQLQVQINKDTDEEQFRLLILKTQEQIALQATLGNEKNKDVQQEPTNYIQEINIEDIREIKETSYLKNVDTQQLLKQEAVATETKSKKIDSKKQSQKQESNNGESQDDNQDIKKDQEGKEVVTESKSKISNTGFALMISFYNNQTQEFQEKADTIGLIFKNQKDRIKWFTYLKYIKERLQFKYFTERFNDVPAIANNRQNKKEGQPNKPSDFFLNQGVSTTATRKQQLIDKMQLVKVQGSSNLLKNKIGQALKNLGEQQELQYQTKAFQSKEQLGKYNSLFQQIQIIEQKLLDQKALSKNEKAALQNKYYELQQKQTQLLKIKERLKIFYQFSVNQFCSHVAMTPLRPTIKTRYWNQKNGIQQGQIVYLYPSSLQQVPQNISNQTTRVLQQYEILSERSSGRGEEEISEESYIANEQDFDQQQNQDQDNSLKTDSYFQVNEQEDLQIQLTEIVKNNLQETMRSYIQDQDYENENNQSNSLKTQSNNWNRIFFPKEKKNSQNQESQEVPYHLKVLRILAQKQKFIELAELKKNIENTQNIFYEQKRAIIMNIALPFEKPFVDPKNFRKKKDYEQHLQSMKKYPKTFQEGPLVYKFIQDEKDEIVEEKYSFQNSIKKSIKSQISQQLSLNQQQNNLIISHEVQVSELDRKLSSQNQFSQSHFKERMQYNLKCQHSKKVFSDEEIQNFKLKRRKETAETRFDIEMILGINREQDNEESDQKQMEDEMQNMLAYAISKVLEQKSAFENVNNLIVKEIKQQIQNQNYQHTTNEDVDEIQDDNSQSKLSQNQIQVKQSAKNIDKKRQLRKDASLKLIKSLTSQQNSQLQIKNLLNSSLTFNQNKNVMRMSTQNDNGKTVQSQKQFIQ